MLLCDHGSIIAAAWSSNYDWFVKWQIHLNESKLKPGPMLTAKSSRLFHPFRQDLSNWRNTTCFLGCIWTSFSNNAKSELKIWAFPMLKLHTARTCDISLISSKSTASVFDWILLSSYPHKFLHNSQIFFLTWAPGWGSTASFVIIIGMIIIIAFICISKCKWSPELQTNLEELTRNLSGKGFYTASNP